MAWKFCHTFRFIDDLVTSNNENLEKNIQNIYSAELKLKREKQFDKNANFLDLNIKIQNSRFQIKLYEKRENYDLYSILISVSVSFVRSRKSSMSLINISIIAVRASSIGTGGYKFTTSKEVCISFGGIFHSFAS